MIRIEFEPPKELLCDCCGGTTVSLTRFVFNDDGPYAVYYARFGRKHPNRTVDALVSLGEWGEESGPWDRVAFPLRIWVESDKFGVTCAPAAESPWPDAKVTGRMLDREEALAHERIKEVFHITDHIVVEDPLIREYLNTKQD